MNAETTAPYALLTLAENDEVTLKLARAYALADLLNCVYHGPGDGPEPESLEWISGLLFEYLGNIESLMKIGRERDSAARQEAA